ncbi:hypothetical protein, partial [Roseibium sp. RKSG952]|uniref:hypothetical protein n=1 Tax=Roseibium sp. RKSG952 TaxID=2529384 RepID=UPI001AD8FBD1
RIFEDSEYIYLTATARESKWCGPDHFLAQAHLKDDAWFFSFLERGRQLPQLSRFKASHLDQLERWPGQMCSGSSVSGWAY